MTGCLFYCCVLYFTRLLYNDVMKTIIKRLIIVIICFLTVLSCGIESFAEEESSGTSIIHSRFYVLTTRETRVLDVPFNADWFRQDARIYSHDLAKLSIGLATAAFRPNAADEDHSLADINLRKFLAEAQFTDLRSDDYEKNPGMYTVSTVMGHRKVGEGDDAFELIAVGVCGQGYLDEWESNFSIGAGNVHSGFDHSSKLVFDRIFGYIASADIEGPCKIWISGFSRAAAISNITAARLSDSNMFSQKDVFAYTFATPRTVMDKLYGRYENIFNIVGKADPVPCVPYADWGYERYGRTLYTPAMETDSDFESKRVKANEVYKELTGIDYWYNHEANDLSRDILAYMLEICPDVRIYASSLQPHLIHLWQDRSAVNILSNLLDLANDPLLINENTRHEANMLLNYLLYFGIDFLDSSNVFSRWNDSASLGGNILQSHTPELYVSWLYSSDTGEELYSQSSSYTTVLINGPGKVELTKDGEVIETLEGLMRFENGEMIRIEDREKIDIPDDYLYMNYMENGILVTVPKDGRFRISVTSEAEDLVYWLLADYTAGKQIQDNAVYYAYTLRENDGVLIYPGAGEDEIIRTLQPSEGLMTVIPYNEPVSAIHNMARQETSTLSWRDAAIIVISVLIGVVSLVLFIIVDLVGRVRFRTRVKKGWIPEGTKYRAAPVFCIFVIFMEYFIMQFFMQLFPDDLHYVLTIKTVIAVLSCLIALSGYLHRRNTLSGFILIGLICLGVADVVTSNNIAFGAILHIIAYLVLSYAYYKEEPPGWKRIAAWALFSVIGLAQITLIPGGTIMLRLLLGLYICTATGMVICSLVLPRRVFYGSIMLYIAGILLVYNQVNGTTFISHAISLGVYYMAVTSLATSNTRIIMRRLIPEGEPEVSEI